jgi:chorismate mutase
LSPGSFRQLVTQRSTTFDGGRGDDRRNRLYDAIMTSPMVRRGARERSRAQNDTPEEVNEATQELIGRDDGAKRPASRRRDEHVVHDDDRSHVHVSRASARGVGFGDVPLMCASEIAVPGAMARVVRIMMHVYSSRARSEIHHVYLRHAQSLRDDLPE